MKRAAQATPPPWLVAAYVPGTSLSDAVERQGPLPDASVLALAAGLAEGLIAIHAAGVIHCDLKPSNVLLAQDGPRIIDFGISSAAEATALTGTGFMVGSPGFMSPEQAEGLTVGPASDIFSLAGVLVYAARRGPRTIRGGLARRGACRRPSSRLRGCRADRACRAGLVPTSGTRRPRGQAVSASGPGG